MGMDLIGKNEDMHFNWTGWRILCDLLYQLECDTSEMAGSNDGDTISEETCKVWAKAIKTGLKDKIFKSKKRKDELYYGGFYKYIVVDSTGRLNKDDREWLENVADFFDTCGGVEQW